MNAPTQPDDTIGEDSKADESPSRQRTPLGWRLLLASGFVVAGIGGFLFEERIVQAFWSLIPSPDANRQILYWQAPMNPSFHSDQPGKSPMGMELVPVYADAEPALAPVMIQPEIQETEYTTTPVEKGPLVRTLESVSTVTFAEPLTGDITLKMEAWLEKLFVDYEGQTVKKGDPLFEVYAPNLVSAQEEFLLSLKAKQAAGRRKVPPQLESQQPTFEDENLRAVSDKLSYFDVTEAQIDALARSGLVKKTLTFYSPFSGIVIEKQAFAGKAIPAGQLLYRIADLSKVWVNVFIYENQIHCTYEGQGATLTLSELPGRTFSGKVVFIYPYLEPKSRTVKVRLEFDNPDLALMPDMFGRVKLEPHRMGMGLSVPHAAVMQTGKRSLVYVALPGNRFEAREIRIGMELDGDKLEVLDGLQAGERVVTSPDFLLDSESRIRSINRKFQPLPADSMQGMPNMPGMKHPHSGHGGKKNQ